MYWVKIISFANWQRIFDFSKATEGSDTTFLMAINNSTLYVAGRGASGAALPEPEVSICAVSLDTWYHITCTVVNKTCSVYVNGTLTKQFNLNNDLGVVSFVNTYIGKSNWNADPLFHGKISDFRIYATVLSDADIKELYNSPISVTNTGALITLGEFKEE